jgi:VWFA-related protein
VSWLSTRRNNVVFCAACCLSLFICALTISPALVGAQSGRRTASPPPSRRPAQERPRTVSNTAPNATPSPNLPAATPNADAKDDAPVFPPVKETTSAPAVARPANAPAALSEEVDEDEVVRVNSNLVPVPATVLDKRGYAVLDLQVKDFELRVDGELKPIGDVSRAETPVRMAMLYDNSSSLRAGREFEKKAAIRFFQSVMRPVDQAALYSVSTEPSLVMPLTSEVRALTRIVEHFPQPEGATSLFDAIAVAADYLRPHTGRKVLVIVSDGVDTTSRMDFDETLRRLLDSDCQFFAVQTGHSDNTNLRDLVAERRLQEFAAQTGGAVYAPKLATELDTAFAQISADLAQQYILSYYPTDERRDGRFRAFSLRVVTRPDARVRTRKGYYAPKG